MTNPKGSEIRFKQFCWELMHRTWNPENLTPCALICLNTRFDRRYNDRGDLQKWSFLLVWDLGFQHRFHSYCSVCGLLCVYPRILCLHIPRSHIGRTYEKNARTCYSEFRSFFKSRFMMNHRPILVCKIKYGGCLHEPLDNHDPLLWPRTTQLRPWGWWGNISLQPTSRLKPLPLTTWGP